MTATRLTPDDCRVEDLRALVATPTRPADHPHASTVEQNVPIYSAETLRSATGTTEGTHRVEAELVRALADGPGVVVIRGAFPDTTVVDRLTDVFDAIIAEEESAGAAPGDHFARPGANSRVWNALEKVALRDPAAFVDYYANDMLALAARSWLGPGYQVTSQVNVVRPGGVAQDPHRDYHLGFLGDEVSAQYPAHVHLLSPVLTLQGAVAHSDMPLESGPTLYLPHSQKYRPGYLAYRRPEFRELFAEQHVQLPLTTGDAAFFNPALLHGAGSNVSADLQRTANLLQVSSAFGRAMETVDRRRITSRLYPLLRHRASSGAPAVDIENVIACAAEGYPFPTNLDLDQPVGGLTPPSQADLVRRGLAEDWEPARLDAELADHDVRRRTDG
ncbi:phytanoyl-CoA dioxygenase family protein [Aeromicrobium sp. CTD01-1L150]|uniref:phytanoyl-CoA dioxygenase family protein n=1 Tax=Aeromicrobium sp. CTD01-1L150 TaxID=3341830 RepID=UPI0035BEF61D